MDPVITIGLTFYNNAATLENALRSIFAQTFQDWELIIIDDYSTDGSYEIARSVKDPRVKVYREVKRLGFVNALNRMTELAGGEYYARMDADDMMHPERLSRQLEYLKAHQDIDLVDTMMCSIDQKGRPVGIRGAQSLDPRPVVLLQGGFLHHATVMGRTKWFRKNRYDPLFVRAEDCELWCRTFNTSRFARINEPLYFVREGLVDVGNYLRSLQTVRRIIRTHGPKLAGRCCRSYLILRSYMKGAAYSVLGSLNSHDFLVNMRNRRLEDREINAMKTVMDLVLSTDVPGCSI